MPTTTTLAGTAGRILGTAARGLLWAHRTIDWAEVAAIVLQGLQLLIAATLLAGRTTRRAWDALPGISERMGKAYAAWLVPAAPTRAPAPAAPGLAVLPVAALTVSQLLARARAAGLAQLGRSGRRADLLAALA